MSAATAIINEKNKYTFFEALKKAAQDSGEAAKAATLATGRWIKKTVKAVGSSAATVMGWAGNGVTLTGRAFAQTAKAGISLAALGIDVVVSFAGLAAVQTVHVAYKVIYGVGMLLTLPAIYGAWGSPGVFSAWDAYKTMWTPKGWKYYTGQSYYSAVKAVEEIPHSDNVIPFPPGGRKSQPKAG